MRDKHVNEILIEDNNIINDLEMNSKNRIQMLTHHLKNKVKNLDKYSKTKIKISIANKRQSIVHTHLIKIFTSMFLDSD